MDKNKDKQANEEFKIDYDVYVETQQSPLNPDERLKHTNSNQEDDQPKILLQEREVTGLSPDKVTPKSVLDEKYDSDEKRDNKSNDDDFSNSEGIKLDDIDNLSLTGSSVPFAEIADNNLDDLL